MKAVKVELKNKIEQFVLNNYGESELENPSWDIDGLAEELCQEYDKPLDYLDKKKLVLNEFMNSIRVFGRTNHIIKKLYHLFYDETGHYTEDGTRLLKYLDKLNLKAREIESQPRDYSELYNID